jgi:succinate dehydrogenase/fumarate reductase-like Fe-S protein
MPRNDTFGEISDEEHAALRANAQKCITCGQLATVDPQFHATRYAHPPLIMDGGRTLAWSAETMSWQVAQK